MKWLITVWLLAAGTGVSYSIVTERKNMLQRLKEMEHSMRRLAYYMYQWRMPVKEAVEHAAKEEQGVLREFYMNVQRALAEKQTEDFGVLWQENSRQLGRQLPEKIKKIWSGCFIHFSMEPEGLKKQLEERAEKIADYTRELQEKYKGEQRLVFTMGFFASAFLCLILW